MTLHENVLMISKPYLGPATEQFIARQCKAHLKKEAAELVKADMPVLSKWVEIGAGYLMDPKKAVEFAAKVKAL